MPAEATPLIEARGLVQHYDAPNHGTVRAVDGVDLVVHERETVALVGESGCGKSSLARGLLRLQPITGGEIRFRGQDVTHLRGRELRGLRRHMQMVFQDPLASLDPRMRVETIVAEPLVAHGIGDRASRRRRVSELLELVALPDALRARRPRDLSGGQRQRVSIARALAAEPALVVADEAVAALDVSVGAQVLNLLNDLRDRLGLSYLFISHDLDVVRHLADRVAVMYLGRIVEIGPAAEVFENPQHPYTVSLLSATPQLSTGGARRERIVLSGDPPSPFDPPAGCRFHPRCPIGPRHVDGRELCAQVDPQLAGDGRCTACHFAGELKAAAHA